MSLAHLVGGPRDGETVEVLEAVLAASVLGFLIWAVPYGLAELTAGVVELALEALRDLVDGPGQ